MVVPLSYNEADKSYWGDDMYCVYSDGRLVEWMTPITDMAYKTLPSHKRYYPKVSNKGGIAHMYKPVGVLPLNPGGVSGDGSGDGGSGGSGDSGGSGGYTDEDREEKQQKKEAGKLKRDRGNANDEGNRRAAGKRAKDEDWQDAQDEDDYRSEVRPGVCRLTLRTQLEPVCELKAITGTFSNSCFSLCCKTCFWTTATSHA